MSDIDRVALDLLPAAVVRKRARKVAIGALLVAAAFGGIIGLLAGRTAGLITAAAVGIPLLLLAVGEARKRIWLSGSTVTVRALTTRHVDLARAGTGLLITAIRGELVVNLLLAVPRGRALTVPLARYVSVGAIEMGILPLRRLADALIDAGNDRSRTVAALLVAQLRAEARGDAPGERPLRRAAGLADTGRPVNSVHPDQLAALVSELD